MQPRSRRDFLRLIACGTSIASVFGITGCSTILRKDSLTQLNDIVRAQSHGNSNVHRLAEHASNDWQTVFRTYIEYNSQGSATPEQVNAFNERLDGAKASSRATLYAVKNAGLSSEFDEHVNALPQMTNERLTEMSAYADETLQRLFGEYDFDNGPVMRLALSDQTRNRRSLTKAKEDIITVGGFVKHALKELNLMGEGVALDSISSSSFVHGQSHDPDGCTGWKLACASLTAIAILTCTEPNLANTPACDISIGAAATACLLAAQACHLAGGGGGPIIITP